MTRRRAEEWIVAICMSIVLLAAGTWHAVAPCWAFYGYRYLMPLRCISPEAKP